MKALVFSDLHGKRDSSLFLLERLEGEKPDLLILLGDILYHGPRNDVPAGYNPKGVIEDLSKIKCPIISVRGNCEAEVDQMVLPFPVLSETAMVYDSKSVILLSHGHIWNEENIRKEGITHFFSGHTHVAKLYQKEGITYLNPGSISIPKDSYGGSYALWNNGNIKLLRKDGSLIAETGGLQ